MLCGLTAEPYFWTYYERLFGPFRGTMRAFIFLHGVIQIPCHWCLCVHCMLLIMVGFFLWKKFRNIFVLLSHTLKVLTHLRHLQHIWIERSTGVVFVAWPIRKETLTRVWKRLLMMLAHGLHWVVIWLYNGTGSPVLNHLEGFNRALHACHWYTAVLLKLCLFDPSWLIRLLFFFVDFCFSYSRLLSLKPWWLYASKDETPGCTGDSADLGGSLWHCINE
jgi:hypothetical protein